MYIIIIQCSQIAGALEIYICNKKATQFVYNAELYSFIKEKYNGKLEL